VRVSVVLVVWVHRQFMRVLWRCLTSLPWSQGCCQG